MQHLRRQQIRGAAPWHRHMPIWRDTAQCSALSEASWRASSSAACRRLPIRCLLLSCWPCIWYSLIGMTASEACMCRYSFVKYGGVDQGMRCCTNMIGVIPAWLQNGSVCNLGLSAMHYIIVATLSIATVHLMVSDQ